MFLCAKSLVVATSKATKATTKAKASSTTLTSTKTAANTSKKRRLESPANDTEQEDVIPAKKQRGAPKMETASKKPAATSSKAKASSSKSVPITAKAATKPQVNGINESSKKRKSDDEGSEQEETQPPAKKARAVPEKKSVEKPKKVINVAPKKKMNVYVMGEGSAGELGLGSAKGVTDVKRPRLNALLSAETVGVVQVATGGMHAIALTHDNKILSWGVNDQGALGRDTTWDGGLKDVDANNSDSDAGSDSGLNPAESTPTAISMDSLPENTVFVQVAAGDSISMALTDEGFVYGWGTFRASPNSLTVSL